MKLNKTVSVIIPCRNEVNFIKNCLDSFEKQTYPKDLYEVLVCDGISNDGTGEIIKEAAKNCSNIKVINNELLTTAHGMNLGIKYSKSDVIIIFGAHAHANRDFIERSVEALFSHKDIACAGGTMETISDSEMGQAIALSMTSPFGVGNALFRYADKEMYVDTVAFGAYKREIFKEVGYFDETIVRGQDYELNFRITQAGYKILLSPKIKSSYYSRSTFEKLWKQYYQYGFWKVKAIQKHGKTSSVRHYIPAIFVTGNILGSILSLWSIFILKGWLSVLLLYLILNMIFSIKLVKRKVKFLKYIPMSFVILHCSYGIGFLEGLINFYVFKSNHRLDSNTQLSR